MEVVKLENGMGRPNPSGFAREQARKEREEFTGIIKSLEKRVEELEKILVSNVEIVIEKTIESKASDNGNSDAGKSQDVITNQ